MQSSPKIAGKRQKTKLTVDSTDRVKPLLDLHRLCPCDAIMIPHSPKQGLDLGPPFNLGVLVTHL